MTGGLCKPRSPEQRANGSSQMDSKFHSCFSMSHPETWTRGRKPGKPLSLEKGEQATCPGAELWSPLSWEGPASMMNLQSVDMATGSREACQQPHCWSSCQSCSDVGSGLEIRGLHTCQAHSYPDLCVHSPAGCVPERQEKTDLPLGFPSVFHRHSSARLPAVII